MRQLAYQYHLDDALLVIEDLQKGLSVYELADQVLAQIIMEVGPIQGRHILWQGTDGLWDLLLPQGERIETGMGIYPLGGRNLAEAKTRLTSLIDEGLIPEKIT